MGQTIAVHAGKRVVLQPGVPVERELRAHLGQDWRQTLPVGAVLATVTLAGMARVEYVDPMTGYAIHDGRTEIGCAAGLGWTQTDPWGDFSPGRWLMVSWRREEAARTGAGRWPSIILALGC